MFEFARRIEIVTVVGAGGTGAQVARIAARIIYDMRARRMHTPRISIFDCDVVEGRNVGRQLFVEGEIGKNKAEVVARRLNLALGLDIEAIPTAFQGDYVSMQSGLIIGCVDSEAGRNAIAQHMKREGGKVWVDCGNDQNSGQVVVGTTDDWSRIVAKKERRNGGGEKEVWSNLPHAGAVFPALLKPEKGAKKRPQRRGESCAAALVAGTQHLLINDLMAAVAGQYLYSLLHNKPLLQWLTYVDGETLTMRSAGVSAEEIYLYKKVAG